ERTATLERIVRDYGEPAVVPVVGKERAGVKPVGPAVGAVFDHAAVDGVTVPNLELPGVVEVHVGVWRERDVGRHGDVGIGPGGRIIAPNVVDAAGGVGRVEVVGV